MMTQIDEFMIEFHWTKSVSSCVLFHNSIKANYDEILYISFEGNRRVFY
jgi:hypothetical protein